MNRAIQRVSKRTISSVLEQTGFFGVQNSASSVRDPERQPQPGEAAKQVEKAEKNGSYPRTVTPAEKEEIRAQLKAQQDDICNNRNWY
jgi:hypothetical protein